MDSSGSAYITGWTDSTDFPTASAIQGSYNGNYDAFVARLIIETNSPVVSLLSPNGGEVIPSGTDYLICWGAPSSAETFNLSSSLDNGATWKVIRKNLTGRIYKWSTSTFTGNKRKCLVKVVGFDASDAKVGGDKSDKPFTIEVLKLTAPSDPGISIKFGDTYNIGWTTNMTVHPVEKVALYYTKNATAVPVTWKPIAAFKPDDYPSIYPWPVPALPIMKTKCKMKVVLKDAKGLMVGSDVSDSCFTIQPVQ